jgi:hypothetical protein
MSFNSLAQVQTFLESIGFTEFKALTKKRLAVLTPTRSKAAGYILSELPSATHIISSASSFGAISIDGFEIVLKPLGQGLKSAGVENEHILIDTINNSGCKIIKFVSDSKTFLIENVSHASSVGTDTKNRKKADIIINTTDGLQVPISIKKDSAEYWESADSLFGERARIELDSAISKGSVELTVDENGLYKVFPSIAVEPTIEEKIDVVFGSDILGAGAVITKTFLEKDFTINDDTLIIAASSVITDISDVIGTDKDVLFLIRNDSTRNSKIGYKGLRVLAAYRKRINKNVFIVV